MLEGKTGRPCCRKSREAALCALRPHLAASRASPAPEGAPPDLFVVSPFNGSRFCDSLHPLPGHGGYVSDDLQRGLKLILSTVKVEDFDRFWETFSTKGAEKRKQHGSRGSHVFRDPNDDQRVWVVFDWDEEGYKNLLSDPDMPTIFQEAGLQGRPETAELAREHDS
jgi:hypothetical protein